MSCEYCDGAHYKYIGEEGVEVSIEGQDVTIAVRVTVGDDPHWVFVHGRVNYCPMCGRRLEEK